MASSSSCLALSSSCLASSIFWPASVMRLSASCWCSLAAVSQLPASLLYWACVIFNIQYCYMIIIFYIIFTSLSASVATSRSRPFCSSMISTLIIEHYSPIVTIWSSPLTFSWQLLSSRYTAGQSSVPGPSTAINILTTTYINININKAPHSPAQEPPVPGCEPHRSCSQLKW